MRKVRTLPLLLSESYLPSQRGRGGVTGEDQGGIIQELQDIGLVDRDTAALGVAKEVPRKYLD